MALAGVSEDVQVTADQTVLDVASARTTTTISAKLIEQLPRGRTFNTLLQVAPGVGQSPRPGRRESAGINSTAPAARRTCSSSTASTSPTSEMRRSSTSDAIPFEFLQEVQVKSGGFEAEFGGALGGVVNVVSKSGTQQRPRRGALPVLGLALEHRSAWQRSDATCSTPPKRSSLQRMKTILHPTVHRSHARRTAPPRQAALLRRLRSGGTTPIDRSPTSPHRARPRSAIPRPGSASPRERPTRLRAVPDSTAQRLLLLESSEDHGASEW